MLTEERLAELERAAATGLDERRAGHRDMVLSVRADELLALCWAARGECHDADIDRSIIRRQARDLLDRARAISHSWEQFARPSNSSNSGSEWLDYRESARLLNEAIALLERIAGETGK